MIFRFISFYVPFFKENVSVKCESETEERQFTSGTEPVNKSVEEMDSSVTPRCRKRRHSSCNGKTPGKKRFYIFLEITETATLKLTYYRKGRSE